MTALLEYQPTLFDNVAIQMLRYELEKQRKAFFVRYNALERRFRELEEKHAIVERNICQKEHG